METVELGLMRRHPTEADLLLPVQDMRVYNWSVSDPHKGEILEKSGRVLYQARKHKGLNTIYVQRPGMLAFPYQI